MVPRILVVDDNPKITSILTMICEMGARSSLLPQAERNSLRLGGMSETGEQESIFPGLSAPPRGRTPGKCFSLPVGG